MNSFISSDLFLLTLTTGLFCLSGIIYSLEDRKSVV